MTFGSLFSGIGGFDLGLGRAGMICLWQVEIDPHCRKLLAHRWPSVERHDDVRTAGTALATVDLICGGFPCQDISVAGGRAGLGGERSGLWWEFHRILAIARPRLCLIENVPGLLSSGPRDADRKPLAPGLDLALIVRGLVELGYGVAWRILDAQFAGLAQRRDRVFIIGSLGTGSAAEILFEPSSVRWDPAPRRTAGKGIGPTIARGAGGGGLGPDAELSGGIVAGSVLASPGHHGHGSPYGDAGDLITPALRVGGREQGAGSSSDNTPIVAQTIRSNMRNNSDPYTEAGGLIPVAATIAANGGRTTDGAEGTRNLIPDVAWALQERDGKGPDSDTKEGHLIPVAVGENGRGETRLSDVSRAMSGGGGKPGQGYPATMTSMGVRRLTPRECERLQGFPDDWTEGFSDSARYKMLGNAVAVPVAAWIGRRILEATR